jgi:hypothetical protein
MVDHSIHAVAGRQIQAQTPIQEHNGEMARPSKEKHTSSKPLYTTIEVKPQSQSHRHTHPHIHDDREDEVQYSPLDAHHDVDVSMSNGMNGSVTSVNDHSPLLGSSSLSSSLHVDHNHENGILITNGNGTSPSSPTSLSKFSMLKQSIYNSIHSKNQKSLCDNYSTVAVASEDAHWIKKLLAYTGMGLMVAVGYIDVCMPSTSLHST